MIKQFIIRLLGFSLLMVPMSEAFFAKTLDIPLKLENVFIENILIKQIFTRKNASLRLSDDGSGCQFVEVSHPKVSTQKNKLKVRVKAKIRLGRPVGSDRCFYLVKWNGYIDLYHDINISGDGKQIKIVVDKSIVLTQQLKRDELADAVWQGIKAQLYPKLQSLVIDLQEPIENMKSVLPYVVAPQNKKVFQQAIDSIIVSSVMIKKDGVMVGLQVNVPDLVPVDKFVAKLNSSELIILEQKLDAVDAFTTFAIKHFLQSSVSKDVRETLFTILFDVRYEIVRILEQPEKFKTDPVRRLFLETWQTLSPIFHRLSGQIDDQVISFQLLSFITASDALTSIDRYGADLGLDISVNGLRRLARLLNNDPNFDPIERDEKEDAELRKLFGLNQVSLELSDELSAKWLDYFIKPAAASVNLSTKLTVKLNNWVPKKHELNRYLPMVEKVLSAVSQSQLDANKLSKPIRIIYRNLVYAAAWQESCWKQFSNVKGFRKPLRSYSGDLGLMQINPRVWRGFYNLHKLKWDIVYNANAGTEILMHYMQRYVIRNKEHIKTGKMENIARATYSGYNGGPSQYKRYRKKNISGKLKRIDIAFYDKYKAVRDNGSMSVKRCYAGI